MFLKLDGTLKAVTLVSISGFAVAFSFLSNNPYISSSVNRFAGNNSLVQYSEDPELEEIPPPVLKTSEDFWRLLKIFEFMQNPRDVSSFLMVLM